MEYLSFHQKKFIPRSTGPCICEQEEDFEQLLDKHWCKKCGKAFKKTGYLIFQNEAKHNPDTSLRNQARHLNLRAWKT
ncbi:hypothetical protein MCOR25_002560 [Pyricularia grisea]|nr:hypothetical protein MCOR25_002560 [Pyricularia grisea]